jgi:hypothetical protein
LRLARDPQDRNDYPQTCQAKGMMTPMAADFWNINNLRNLSSADKYIRTSWIRIDYPQITPIDRQMGGIGKYKRRNLCRSSADE